MRTAGRDSRICVVVRGDVYRNDCKAHSKASLQGGSARLGDITEAATVVHYLAIFVNE